MRQLQNNGSILTLETDKENLLNRYLIFKVVNNDTHLLVQFKSAFIFFLIRFASSVSNSREVTEVRAVFCDTSCLTSWCYS